MKKKGSVFGGILLISGSCIGAGMLGIPILTGIAGFYPTLLLFIVVWAFMTYTGLLLVEVNGWFSNRVNFITMVGTTLGVLYRRMCWVLYLLLFYALLVAYTVGSGNIFSTFLRTAFHWPTPDWMASLFFILLFGWIVYLGTRPVDLSNRLFMVGKIVSFVGLVALGIGHLSWEKLARVDFPYTLIGLSLLITSFGFHNMIPTITNYLGGDIKRVKKTILGGSFLSLVIYLIWEVIVLGIVPLEGEGGLFSTLKRDQDASQALVAFLGRTWVSSFGQSLAFFAILTSFLAQSLGLVHFWEDGLDLPETKRENPWICLLALGPPLLISVIYPQLFFQALNFAGGFCAVILFGIFPVWMVWRGRYKQKKKSEYRAVGGKGLLFITCSFAFFVFVVQILSMFGIKLWPHV